MPDVQNINCSYKLEMRIIGRAKKETLARFWKISVTGFM